MIARLTVAVIVAATLAACGSSTLSARQMRAGADRTCTRAGRRLDQIVTPTAPAQGADFLRRGIATLSPELTTLAALRPGSNSAPTYRRAEAATARELQALESALNQLRAGGDPVEAIRSLQRKLDPLEQRASADWRGLGVPACATA
ncbi:MAG: hypothetical protein WAL63_18410 [Solirubrobacteraceae bacterium]